MKRLTSFAVAAAAGIGGLLSIGAPVASAASSHAPAAHATKAQLAQKAFEKSLKNNISTMQKAKAHSKNPTDADSFNWSGYADTSVTAGTFTAVSGSWTMPTLTCSKEDEIASFWVGLDGATDGTVEQDGTSAQCFEGSPFYYTWYEMYPAGTVEEGTSVAPKDAITASVTKSGTSYTLAVTDATHTANSFSATSSCAAATCLDESAEWIAERPSYSIGIVPQANYSTWTCKQSTVNGTGTISSFTDEALTMIDGTQSYALDTTAALNASGKQFKTTWLNSY